MKIAKQIAEEHYRLPRAIHDLNHPMAKGMLENIVAAKLEPVKEALNDLNDLVESAGWGYMSDERGLASGKIEAALALFEEDSLTSDSVEQLIDSEAREGERVAAQIYTAIQQHKLDHESYPRLIMIGAGVAMCFPDTYNGEPCYSREEATMFGIHVMISLMDGWELIV